MRKLSLHRILSILFFYLLPAFWLSGCTKGTNSTGSTPSIAGYIESNSGMTLLKNVLVRTGLDSVFKQGGPYTVFGANDAAFSADGLTSANIGNITDSQWRSIVLYSAYAGSVLTSNLPKGPNAKMTTLGGDSLFVTNSSNGIYINGIQLVQGDILTSNGVLDIMAGVLLPPTGNITQKLAQADTSLAYTVAAISRASQGATNLSALLSNHGPYTFFVPDNDAWRAGGFPSTSSISAANPDSLANILEYHIVSGRLFTSDMLSGANPVGLNQEPFTISTPTINGNTISGKKNTSPGNLIYTNVMAQNGVLHVITILLKP